jgi:hypothetical protein
MCGCCARCTWGCGFHIYILSLVSQLIQSHSIAKDAAAKAKKKRAATRPTTIPQNRLNQSHKRKAASQKDKIGSKRSRSDGSEEDEENSDDSDNGGGEAAAGLTTNSTHNTPLGETQENPRAPVRRSTRVTRTRKVSFTTRRQAFPTKQRHRRMMRPRRTRRIISAVGPF